jgi:hypothetical protein
MSKDFNIDPNIAYDVVELPSRGIYYENKKQSIRVSYLTAADEDIFLSQNLINQGRVIEEMLKRKIIDTDISVDELVQEDREAILVFLRNTAFGTNYNFTVIDPDTKKEFDVDIDLSTLNIKEFKLTPNSKGHYTYKMEKIGKTITFMFLSRIQEKILDEIIKNSANDDVPPVELKRLELLIKSIDGDEDQFKILNFIKTLPILESKKFKKFVNENKPGLDLKRTVTTPSGKPLEITMRFGVEFFRPFFKS